MLLSLLLLVAILLINVNHSLPTKDQLQALDDSIDGDVIYPDDPNFATKDQAWFLINDDLVSSAIIFANNEQDIVKIIKFLNGFDDIKFRIRSSGSSFGGYSKCTGCYTLNLQRMQSINYLQSLEDEETIYAEVTAGTQMYRIADSFNNPYSVKIPHSYCPNVSVSGFYSSGGRHNEIESVGFAGDSVVAIRVILYDGSVLFIYDEDIDRMDVVEMLLGDEVESEALTIKEQESGDRDLLWAVRGSGGGQFGVISTFYIKTYDIPQPEEILFAHLIFKWEYESAVSVMSGCQSVGEAINEQRSQNEGTYRQNCEILPIDPTDPNQLLLFPSGYLFRLDFQYFGPDIQIARDIINDFINFDNLTSAAYVEIAGFIREDVEYAELTAISGLGLGIATRAPSIADNRLFFESSDPAQLYQALLDWHWQTFVVPNTLQTQGWGVLVYWEFWGETLLEQDEDAERTSSPNRNSIGMFTAQIGTVIEELWPLFRDLSEQTLNAAFDEVFEPFVSTQTYIGYRSRPQSDIYDYFGEGFGWQNDEILEDLQRIKLEYDPNDFFNLYNLSIPLPDDVDIDSDSESSSESNSSSNDDF